MARRGRNGTQRTWGAQVSLGSRSRRNSAADASAGAIRMMSSKTSGGSAAAVAATSAWSRSVSAGCVTASDAVAGRHSRVRRQGEAR